ncbi:hypothetical protein SAMN05444008_112108 [Cnuella takakiae]|uniref:Uncharacterized protein n=1 Tax=Cnuella takakiae TaxID=1302690 RepID=A0A1M5EMZ4_9BACT|nr:hypothetical protein [Cnuella takakiae]OLY91232.1 hypothetical protein BUE76_04440 [Cnuella takakiae]SHF80514.1 hypothetical protein SAMN05444008_112108 [Cnuella takakiae]
MRFIPAWAILSGMNRLLLLPLLFISLYAQAQSPDFISVRKPNGRTVRSFMPGLPIVLQTKSGGWLEGPIEAIRNDSLIIRQYRVQRYMRWGVLQLDTIGTTLLPIHYLAIQRVWLNKRRSFWQRRTGPLLIIGGGGYLLLNLLNGAILKDPIGSSGNIRKLGISTGALGAGILFQKYLAGSEYSTSRHRIVYVRMGKTGF